MSSLTDSIKKLIEDKKGDTGRLTHILGTIESGKHLYSSDEKYIQSLLGPSIQSITNSEVRSSIQVNSFTITTTNSIEGSKITEYLGIVSGEAVMGANMFRDMFAGVRDIIGGRSGQYEKKFRQAKEIAITEMSDQAKENGANAIVGIKIDYEMVRESMMMVAVQGTAVRVVSD
jgi:uncharacterized protein YbjQ (UPF0145 family)